jgi:hypothetical protein
MSYARVNSEKGIVKTEMEYGLEKSDTDV